MESPREKAPQANLRGLLRGDGRTRTAVQTLYPIAFYTFILPLIVGGRLPKDGPTATYPLSLNEGVRESLRASGLDDTPYAMNDRPES